MTRITNLLSIWILPKRGHPVYLIQKRGVKKQKISLNEASNRAVAFLKKNGYETKGLEIDESAQYNNIGVFSFIPVEKTSAFIRKPSE